MEPMPLLPMHKLDKFQTAQLRWVALTRRDPASHSSFLYGVKTTRIYCRPTCSARLARRANVVFYDTEEEAKRDGFRPCKRCKPNDICFLGEKEEVVSRVLALLRTRKDGWAMQTSLSQLSEEVSVTPSYLCRVFKKTMGVTLRTYLKEFEKEASTTSSPSELTSSVASPDSMLPTTATTPLTPFWPNTEINKEADSSLEWMTTSVLDLDFNDWLWTDEFSHDSNYGWDT